MSTYPFAYKVLNYDEGKFSMNYGMGMCESFADAAERIESMYGDEMIAIKHLELFEEASLIPMPKAAVESIVNDYMHSAVGFVEGSSVSKKTQDI